MPNTPMNHIDMSEEEFRPFFEKLKTFMKDSFLNLDWIGVKTLKFRAELSKEGGFEIIAETNKALNLGSMQQLRNMIRGFAGGWMTGRMKEN